MNSNSRFVCVNPVIWGRGAGRVGLLNFAMNFGMCTTTLTTGKDNMSRCNIIKSREKLLSQLEDHKLRVSVRCSYHIE
jgi:hypothetical protein